MDRETDTTFAVDEGEIQAAIDTTWRRVLEAFPTLELLGPSGGSAKARLVRAVRDAAARGSASADDLADAAMSAMPRLRNPDHKIR